MLRVTTSSPASSHVTALFNDGSHTFLLPKGSTLAELAGRIADLESFYEGTPIAIHVDFDTPSQWRPTTRATATSVCN